MRLLTAAEVDAAIAEIYGDVDLRSAVGVLHVTAVWEPRPGEHVTLRINDDTPRSARDFFVLNLARARADAIVATGKMLRDEPRLRFDLQGEAAEGLARWRAEALRKAEPPRLVLLTSGRGLDLDHPTFTADMPVTIVTSPAAAQGLGPTISRANVEIVGREHTDIRSVVQWLRSERGAATISIEAGPSTSAALYDEPPLVDELMLSVFEGEAIPDSVRGGAFVGRAELERAFVRTRTAHRVDEPSGPWRFERFVRRQSSG